MKLEYAVERLYDVGWTPGGNGNVDHENLGDGRAFPTVAGVQREFARRGLSLTIKQNIMFNCCPRVVVAGG
jgi:hypothetical protein